MTPTEKVLAALRERGLTPTPSGDGWACRCPAHDDRCPSFNLRAGDDGRAILHCHAGCTPESVIGALGLRWKDLFSPGSSRDPRSARTPGRSAGGTPARPARIPSGQGESPERRRPRTFATAEACIAHLQKTRGPQTMDWTYTDTTGTPIGHVLRWPLPPDPTDPEGKPNKLYLPVSKTEGGWASVGMTVPRPLYKLPELLSSQAGSRVWVCEGEKAADAARALGLVATTSPHGSKSASKADWTAVRGMDVVISIDRDQAGEDFGRDVAGLTLAAGAKSVRIVRLWDLWAELPKGGDVADFVDHRAADAATVRQELEALADQAPKMTPDSIRPLTEQNGGNEFWLVSIADLGPAEEPDWLWRGYLARGAVTLLTGLWKAGKTTLLGHLLRDLYRGSGLVDMPLDAPTLYVSEEPLPLWAERRDRLGLPDSIYFLQRKTFARPDASEWLRLVSFIATQVRERGIGLVVFDTLPSVWPVLDENNAGEMLTALLPLRDISSAGAAVLMVCHPRKTDGSEATATRGSGALTGFPDVILELRRNSRDDDGDTRRLLKAFGRFPEMPPEVVLDLGPNGYTFLGDRPTADSLEALDTIARLLPESAAGWTPEQVREAWPQPVKPGKTRLRGLLNRGVTEGRWDRTGSGVRNQPHRYARRGPGDSNQPFRRLSGGNESATSETPTDQTWREE